MSSHRHAAHASRINRAGRAIPTVPVVTAILVLGLLASIAVLVLHHRGTDRRTSAPAAGTAGASSAPKARLSDQALAAAIIAAASADVTTIASYDYRHLGADTAAAAALVTGGFGNSYTSSLPTTVAAATAHHTVQTFRAQQAGVGAISADGATASALVFGLETVTNAVTRTPAVSALIVGVTLQRVSGQWRVSVLQQGVGPVTTPPGTPQLTDAAVAARAEVVTLLTNSRAGFAAGYARGIAGATGALRAELVAQQASVRSGLTAGGYDSSGQVVGLAVQSAAGSSVQLLIAAQANDVSSAGQLVQQSSPRLRVTMTDLDGRWLASALSAVPAQ